MYSCLPIIRHPRRTVVILAESEDPRTAIRFNTASAKEEVREGECGAGMHPCLPLQVNTYSCHFTDTPAPRIRTRKPPPP
jgi:hypothetical protein